jgi:hypothetical protein
VPTSTGFFDLNTPRDLLQKLEHDYQRILQSPIDTYAAFDFMITANHIPDWLHPKDEPAQHTVRDSLGELRVCRELANGAKHFSLKKKGTAVQGTTVAEAAFDSAAFSGAFQIEASLVIELDGTAAQALGSRIGVDDLAHKIL